MNALDVFVPVSLGAFGSYSITGLILTDEGGSRDVDGGGSH